MHQIHPYRRAHPHSRLLTIEGILFLAFTVFLFLIVGAATNAQPGSVLLAFTPSVVFAIVLVLLVQTDHFMPTYNWFVLIGILALSAIAFVMLPAGQGLDVGTVLLLNALLMAIALTIMHSSYVHEQPIVSQHAPVVHKESHVVHHVHHEAAPVQHANVQAPKEINDVIHSIEDKIKALNFVIGRVYSMYHGGSEKLRNKIRIDKRWYDEFNQIPETDLEKRRHEAIVLVQKIEARLAILQQSEREVFGEEVQALKNIQHAPTGEDSIISVLVRNDKDPVQQYYDGAQQFCKDALSVLKA